MEDNTNSSQSVTGCPSSPGRKYSGAKKKVGNLTGFSAGITTNSTVLPCEPDATYTAFSVAWVGITKSDISKWGQMGYARYRFSPNKAVNFYRYCEVKAGPLRGDYDRTWFPAPTGTQSHTYKGSVDQSNGKWSFSYDGKVKHTFTNTGWKSESGARIDYNAEIEDVKTQMVGTLAKPCVWSGCQYLVQGSETFVDAGLSLSDMFSSDSKKWTNKYENSTTIKVWDVNP